MLYTILCYNCEDTVTSWTKEQDDEVMGKLLAVQEKVAKRGRLGPVARLGPTKTAKTLHKDREPFLLTDGPYAETKEQLAGFFLIDCATRERAEQIASAFTQPGGTVELRPAMWGGGDDQ